MSQLTITSYSPEHREAVAEFQELLWQGGTRRNAAYLDWKYAQNPYVDHRYIVLAWAGDGLAGMVGAFGALWEMGNGDRVMLPCLADTVVAPGLRGSPLFLSMLDTLLEHLRADAVPWLLDFGDQPAGPAMLMRGWRAIGPWAIASSGARPKEAVTRHWVDGEEELSVGPRSAVPVRFRSTVDPAALGDFAVNPDPGGRVRHVRDAEYLHWRFSNPLATYYFLTAGERQLHGYLVAHRARLDALDGPTPTTIMECEAQSEEIWLDLIELALSRLAGREVLMWARDLSAPRLSGLQSLGLGLHLPTGRITKDANLPNMLVSSTGTALGSDSSQLSHLNHPSEWDLRAVCGRSWR
jgi:hypothetical protein